MAPRNSILKTYDDVAARVLSETIRLRPGEALTIETWTGGLPLARAVALEAKKLGAFPLVTYEDEKNYVKGVRASPNKALGKMGKHEFALLSDSDAYVFIPGPPLAGYYPRISRKEFMDSTSYNGSWYEAAKKSRLRGARLTFGYIGGDLARLLGKDAEEVVTHQLKAALVDSRTIRANARKLVKHFTDGGKAALSTKGQELTFKLKGELEVQDGITDADDVESGNNMSYVPAGYVAKDIDPASVTGTVRLSPSITRYGLLQDSEASFKKGKFVSWSSKSSPEVLRSLEGVLPEKLRVPAYLLVGINPWMRFGYGQDRFPEGSISIGVGFGGIVKNGTLSVDGQVVVKDGRLSR